MAARGPRLTPAFRASRPPCLPARPAGAPGPGAKGSAVAGVGGRGAGAMCERGREAGSSGCRLRCRPCSRPEPGRELDWGQGLMGSGVRVLVGSFESGSVSDLGCWSWARSVLGLRSSPRAGFSPALGECRSPWGGLSGSWGGFSVREGALKTTWGRSKVPRATLFSGSKVIAPAGENFFLLGSPHLLPDNLIDVPRGRRGRGD